MGGVIEALWGFFGNEILAEKGQTKIELRPGCMVTDITTSLALAVAVEWDPATRAAGSCSESR